MFLIHSRLIGFPPLALLQMNMTPNPANISRTFLTLAIFSAASLGVAMAEIPRVLPAGTLPNDVRLEAPKDLNGYFPFTPPKSKAEWDERAGYVRRQILVEDHDDSGVVRAFGRHLHDRGFRRGIRFDDRFRR